MSDYLALYDYRVRVAAFYHERNQALLAGEDAASVLQHFRASRDQLFATHSQSALDEGQRREFQGLHYFPYNPAMRFATTIDAQAEPERQTIAMNAQEEMTMTTVGRVRFVVDDALVVLSLYWLDVYGGGLFLPFRDATCPAQSYGGGRYLFDTMKGSTPVSGVQDGKHIVLDFNYAYNPSCAYNDLWVCPLAPVENRVNVFIRAGEQNYKR